MWLQIKVYNREVLESQVRAKIVTLPVFIEICEIHCFHFIGSHPNVFLGVD